MMPQQKDNKCVRSDDQSTAALSSAHPWQDYSGGSVAHTDLVAQQEQAQSIIAHFQSCNQHLPDQLDESDVRSTVSKYELAHGEASMNHAPSGASDPHAQHSTAHHHQVDYSVEHRVEVTITASLSWEADFGDCDDDQRISPHTLMSLGRAYSSATASIEHLTHMTCNTHTQDSAVIFSVSSTNRSGAVDGSHQAFSADC